MVDNVYIPGDGPASKKWNTKEIATDVHRLIVGHPPMRSKRVTPVASATPDYGIDDVLGGKMLIDGIAELTGGSGHLQSVMMIGKVDIPASVTIDLLFFDTDPTNSTFTDNAAVALNVADLAFLVGAAQLSTRIDLGTPALLLANNLNIPLDTLTTDDLWCVAIVRGAATLNLAAADDITFVFGFAPD